MQKLNKNLIATVTTTSLIVGLCAPAAIADADVTGGYDGWDTVVRRETSTPGGFSSVAEPAGPVAHSQAKPNGTKSTAQSPPPKPRHHSTSTSLTPTALLQIR